MITCICPSIFLFCRLKYKTKSMIDTTAKIAANAQIGKGTIIEEFTVIAPNAKIGDECKIHRNIFIDSNVIIGNRVKYKIML